MKILKKVLKITAITLLVLIVLAFIIPVIFKKPITRLVRNEINKNINAKVDFKNVSLSLFRHFPKISISLADLSVTGINEFANDTLISTKTLDASVNLFSAIKGKDIKVYAVYLKSPRIHALVNKEGKANWDIAKESTDTSAATDNTPSEFKMNLQKYEISDGYILYKDESSNMKAEISGLNHEGSGDFTQDVFTLSTKTKADAADLIYASIPYLANTNADIDADIQIDNTTNKYTFKTNAITLNNLKLNAEGFFQLTNDSTYNMDIKFKSPTNDFKDILSLVPGIYKNDFANIKTNGEAAFNGFVKGTYSPQQMPAYDVNLEVRNGSFQYPDLPKPVKNIQLDLHAVNPDGLPDNAVLDISKGHVEMDNEPFDFHVLFKNPETIRYIDAVAKGKLNLSQLTQFIKLDEGTKLKGLLWADAFIKGNMSAIQNQQGEFQAGGFFNIKDLFYSSKDFPQPLQNGNLQAELVNTGGVADNTTINISSGHIEVGKDPVDFTLKLSKPVSDVNFDGSAKGHFTLDNVRQFTGLEPGTAISGIMNADIKFTGNKTMIDKKEYDKINISGSAGLDNVKYVSKDYPTGISISNTAATFTPANVTISNFAGNYLQSNFSGNGSLDNLIGFLLKDQSLKGSLNATVDKMNLNDWMGTAKPVSGNEAAPANATSFLVPANLDIALNAKAGKVTYDKVDYNNISGSLQLNNETVKLQNIKAEALDGTILLNGSYSTLMNKIKPDMNISYVIKDMDVQKAFLSFNTIQAIMPIGKFLSGKLNSELSMTGNLGGDMMPDLKTLTGKGNLLLIQGVLMKFAPLEKLASALQIDRLKSVSVRDIKNYIEFANGKVLVKPFNLKVDEIEMQIGGMHGFDQTIDYIIAMKVPRKYLGDEGNNLINGLVTQATNKGIPVKLSEMIDLNVKMTGTITNPSIKIDLKKVAGDAVEDLKEQAKDFAQQKIDSTKQTVKDSFNVVKNQVTNDLKEELKSKIFGNKDSTGTNKTDSTKKKAEQTIKNSLRGLFNKKQKPAADSSKKN